ncbi:hypothetical protein ACS0TY_014189 [Phlomoides rotata]
MDPFGNQTGPCVDRVKSGRGRRSWSKIEEDALMVILNNAVLEGWKSNNRFKAGFQRELEKGMKKIIPCTDLVATPHINSKIHVWKKEYGALSDLLSKSGIGWNSTTSMLEIEDEGVWESCIRADIVNELYRAGFDQEGDVGYKYVPLTPDCMNDVEDDIPIKTTDVNPKNMPKGKKRKTNNSDISILVDSLGDFMKFSKNAMTDLCKGTEPGVGSSNDTKQLHVIMKGIIGLKLPNKLKVCDELMQNPKCLELFLSLPIEEQEEYVWMLLDGRL